MRTVAALLVTLGLLAAGERQASAQDKVRKIDKGVGNCICSTGELPLHKESTYKLTSDFKPGDTVHVRCYFPKALREIATDGKLKNSLRGPISTGVAAIGLKPAWYATLAWTDDRTTWWHLARINYVESANGSWTEQRFDQPPGGSKLDKSACDWRMGKFDKPNECVDIETETRNLAAKLKRSGTYRTEICVEVFYEKVDKTKEVRHEELDVVERPVISRGCFQYTVDL